MSGCGHVFGLENGKGRWPIARDPTPLPSWPALDVKNVPAQERFSPLELFHPDGAVKCVQVIGSACPERLAPGLQAKAGLPADLILLAPSEGECQYPGWLDSRLSSLAQRLNIDGFVYGLVPPAWRRRVQQLLNKNGLETVLYLLHLPDVPSSRYFVPLRPVPARYGFTSLIPTRPWKRTFTLALLKMPGGAQLAGRYLPSIGFAAARPGSRSLFSWLYSGNSDPPTREILVSASWRKIYGSAVIHAFRGSSQPSVVAKVSWRTERPGRQIDPVSLLNQFRADAEKAGARVPKSLPEIQTGGRQVYRESAITGRTAAAILYQHPGRLDQLVERLSGWLAAWNRITRKESLPNQDLFDRELLTPASLLVRTIKDGEQYLRWLMDRCKQIETVFPLVSSHNDLTMWNILIDRGGSIGVVDWNQAREASFPLKDYFYATTDALTLAKGLDRDEAFHACFLENGQPSDLVSRCLSAQLPALAIPDQMIDLCLHACFLGHAVDELLTTEQQENRPFLNIVQSLAREREQVRNRISGL